MDLYLFGYLFSSLTQRHKRASTLLCGRGISLPLEPAPSNPMMCTPRPANLIWCVKIPQLRWCSACAGCNALRCAEHCSLALLYIPFGKFYLVHTWGRGQTWDWCPNNNKPACWRGSLGKFETGFCCCCWCTRIVSAPSITTSSSFPNITVSTKT